MSPDFGNLDEDDQDTALEIAKDQFLEKCFDAVSEGLKTSERDTQPLEKLLEVCPQFFTGCIAERIKNPLNMLNNLRACHVKGMEKNYLDKYDELIKLEEKIEKHPLPALSEAIVVQFEAYVKARMDKVFDNHMVGTPAWLNDVKDTAEQIADADSSFERSSKPSPSVLFDGIVEDDERIEKRKERLKFVAERTDPISVFRGLAEPEAARRKLVNLIGQGLDAAEGIFSDGEPENSNQAEMIVRMMDVQIKKVNEKIVGRTKA